MDLNTKEIGNRGEQAAAAYLTRKGYTVLETNWQHRKLEVDIIAAHGGFLVIVEVKTRRDATFGEPETFVTRKKQQFLIKAANAYIEQKGLELEVRFDIVAIISGDAGPRITHIEDAFYPTLR